MNNSIDMETLLTTIYVLVDDWYEAEGKALLQGKVGKKPEFRDSEVITLMLAQDFIPYPGENQFMGFIRANYLGMFPRLVDQSQYNRRARQLGPLVESLRQHRLHVLDAHFETDYLLDTKPLPVMGYKRSKSHSDFAGSAAYGYCASRNLKYFGYKLVSLTTLHGLPVVFDLVPANLDEREAAEAVVCHLTDCDIWADKGFVGQDWQAQIRAQTGNRIWTVKRVNQKQQNPTGFDRLLNRVRERIEGTYNEIQNTGRNLERLLAKTVLGLCVRVLAKMTSHLLKYLLQRNFGIEVQTFEQIAL